MRDVDPLDFEMVVRLKRHLALELLGMAAEEYLASAEFMAGLQLGQDEDLMRKVLEDFQAIFLEGTGWEIEELLH
jgi:hypothetical protein